MNIGLPKTGSKVEINLNISEERCNECEKPNKTLFTNICGN